MFRAAYPALRRYAGNRGLGAADAEDIVARTLEIAWVRLDDVPADDPLPWLYAVARNLLRNQRRADARRSALITNLIGQAQVRDEGVSLLQRPRLRAALARLSENDQELLRLVAWDELTPSQAAVVLDCSPEAVRTRLHRARRRLAATLHLDIPARPPRVEVQDREGVDDINAGGV